MDAGLGTPRAITSRLGPQAGLEGFPALGTRELSSDCTWQTFLRPVTELGFLRVDGVCKELTSVLCSS